MKPRNAGKPDAALDLESLVERLQEGLERRGGDVVDAILRGRRRASAVRALRDHEVVKTFKAELADGLIRVDTARQLLGLLRAAIEAAMK